MRRKRRLLPSEQTFIRSCLDWTAAGIWCVCLGNVSIVVRAHTGVAVCVCFVYAQVSCVLTEVSFPSIFEENVLASFSLEATLHGVFLTPIFTLRLRALGLRAFLQMTAVRKQTGTVTVKYSIFMFNLEPYFSAFLDGGVLITQRFWSVSLMTTKQLIICQIGVWMPPG